MASHLPEEILVEIFSRLPAKPVGKCKCLSKSWSTYLSTSQFINLHLENRKSQYHGNVFLMHKYQIILITSSMKNVFRSRRIRLKNIEREGVSSLASCNGLVLLQNIEYDLYLVNPITLQQLKITRSFDKKQFRRQYWEDPGEMFGLGYDTSCDDYKIVRLYWDVNVFGENEKRTFVDVYSVKKGAWKTISVCVGHPDREYSCAFVNGALHWTRGGHSFLVGFDLELEVFREVPIPIDMRKYGRITLFVLGGCLCIVGQTWKHKTIYVWIMREYGIAESWIRYPIYTDGNFILIRPLYFVSDDEFLITNQVGDWFAYNVKEQTTKKVDVAYSRYESQRVLVFVDSLVSLDQYVVPTRPAF